MLCLITARGSTVFQPKAMGGSNETTFQDLKVRTKMRVRFSVWMTMAAVVLAFLVSPGSGQAGVEEELAELRKELAEIKKELGEIKNLFRAPSRLKVQRRPLPL